MTALGVGKLPLILAALLLLSRVSSLPAAVTDDDDDDDSSDDVTVPSTTLQDDEDSTTEADDEDKEDWRKDTLIYHIWVRAFQDSDGDGEGDLQGVISRLDYLHDLGVDTIRLSPIYSTPFVDSGDDISNFTDIDPVYGDFNDFYELVHEVHERDLKIILDIIPNHSSDEHEWFIASAADEENYDDYYIWADGKIMNNKLVPPNNWKSLYNDDDGSAWTWHTQKKQWYYHKFHESEPDLNLRNEDVVEEILNVFDFWLERGVDGFCILGTSYFYENDDLLDESSEELGSDENDDDDNSFTVGQPENVDLIYRIREHIDEWVEANDEDPKLLLTEIDEDDDQIISYYGNETNPGITPLNLIFLTKLNETSDAGDIKDLIEDWMELLPEGVETNWILSNEDYSRAASRLDEDLLDGLYMLSFLLPGTTVTYYGEEIGMTNANISWEDTIDIKGLEQLKEDYDDYTRDPARTPMQWDETTSAGFSTNETTFLPVNPNYVDINVEEQLDDADSDLNAYKRLSILRENPIFTEGDYELDAVNDDKVLILKRSLNNDTCIAIINFGSSKETVNLTALYPDLEEDLQVMLDSSNADVEEDNDEDDDDDIENDSFILEANAAAVLCDKDDFSDFPTELPTTTDSDDIDDEDEDDEDDEDGTTTEDDKDDEDGTTTEEPTLVVPETTTEPPPPSAACRTQSLEFIIVIHLALLLLLRML